MEFQTIYVAVIVHIQIVAQLPYHLYEVKHIECKMV